MSVQQEERGGGLNEGSLRSDGGRKRGRVHSACVRVKSWRSRVNRSISVQENDAFGNGKQKKNMMIKTPRRRRFLATSYSKMVR